MNANTPWFLGQGVLKLPLMPPREPVLVVRRRRYASIPTPTIGPALQRAVEYSRLPRHSRRWAGGYVPWVTLGVEKIIADSSGL